jgi:hypothetical protein
VRGGVRYKKSFQLEDFGFTVPQIKTGANIKSEPPKEGNNSKK